MATRLRAAFSGNGFPSLVVLLDILSDIAEPIDWMGQADDEVCRSPTPSSGIVGITSVVDRCVWNCARSRHDSQMPNSPSAIPEKV